MDDAQVLQHIKQLVDEEHQLETRHLGTPLSGEEHERLRGIEVELDQCWDLLRQRRARRQYGESPDDAEARDVRTVEGYQQ